MIISPVQATHISVLPEICTRTWVCMHDTGILILKLLELHYCLNCFVFTWIMTLHIIMISYPVAQNLQVLGIDHNVIVFSHLIISLILMFHKYQLHEQWLLFLIFDVHYFNQIYEFYFTSIPFFFVLNLLPSLSLFLSLLDWQLIQLRKAFPEKNLDTARVQVKLQSDMEVQCMWISKLPLWHFSCSWPLLYAHLFLCR